MLGISQVCGVIIFEIRNFKFFKINIKMIMVWGLCIKRFYRSMIVDLYQLIMVEQFDYFSNIFCLFDIVCLEFLKLDFFVVNLNINVNIKFNEVS